MRTFSFCKTARLARHRRPITVLGTNEILPEFRLKRIRTRRDSSRPASSRTGPLAHGGSLNWHCASERILSCNRSLFDSARITPPRLRALLHAATRTCPRLRGYAIYKTHRQTEGEKRHDCSLCVHHFLIAPIRVSRCFMAVTTHYLLIKGDDDLLSSLQLDFASRMVFRPAGTTTRRARIVSAAPNPCLPLST